MKKSSAKPKARPAPAKASPSKGALNVKVVAKKAQKVVKAVAKKAVSAATKTPLKKSSKSPAKAPVKAPVKATAKTPVKAPVKAPTKVSAKPSTKVAGKGASKPTPKTAAKPATKTMAAAPKKPSSAVQKPVAKASSKNTSQSTAKAPLKTASKAPVKVPAKVSTPPSAAVPVKVPEQQALAPKKLVNHQPVVAGQSIAQPQNKKSSRGAKAASMVPPPPVAVVSNNAAKSSFGPSTTTSLPSVIPVTPKKDSKLANNWKSKPVAELSDAEILSMPDSEYMNDTQMAFFKLKLEALKRDILASAGQTTENLREETVVVPDPADRATIEEEHALELRTRDRERKLLKKIEQSIHRIDGGDYGYCDETGEAIGVGRLLARPTATLSLEAQQRRELKQKMFGD